MTDYTQGMVRFGICHLGNMAIGANQSADCRRDPMGRCRLVLGRAMT